MYSNVHQPTPMFTARELTRVRACTAPAIRPHFAEKDGSQCHSMPFPSFPGNVGSMATSDDLPVPDPANTAAFGKRMVAIIDDAATALLLSIGHQTGLFDTLARMP